MIRSTCIRGIIAILALSMLSASSAFGGSHLWVDPDHTDEWDSGYGRVGATAYFWADTACCPGWIQPYPDDEHYVEYCGNPTITFGSGWNDSIVPHDDCQYTMYGHGVLEAGSNSYDLSVTRDFCGFSNDVPSIWQCFGVAVTRVKGPKKVCAGTTVTYSPVMNDANAGPWACYSITQDDTTTVTCDCWDDALGDAYCIPGRPGGVLYATWMLRGRHTVAFRCGTSEEFQKVEVVLPPDCEVQQCNDDGNTGCTTGACGADGSGPPRPGLRIPWIPIRLPFAPNGMGGGGGGGEPGPGCGGGGGLTFQKCGGDLYAVLRIGCMCYVIPIFSTTTFPMYFADGSKMDRTQAGSTPLLSSYSLTDAQGNTQYFAPPPSDEVDPVTGDTDEAVVTPLLTSRVDAGGRTTLYSRDSTGALNEVSVPNTDESWQYTTEPDTRRITKSVAPDGSTTVIGYDPDADRVSSVRVYESEADYLADESDYLSKIEYFYTDSAGNRAYDDRLYRVEKGDLITRYEYSTLQTGEDVITVREKYYEVVNGQRVESTTVLSETVHTYGTDYTKVTRRSTPGTISSDDQTTTYRYYIKNVAVSGNPVYAKTWLREVDVELEGSAHSVTKYACYVGGDTELGGMTEHVDYEIAPNDVMKGKVFKVTDADNHNTIYTYDTAKGLVTQTSHPGGGTEEYTYYQVNNENTPWTKTVKNIRNNYTRYVRDTADLPHVQAIKVSEPINGNAPSEQEWAAINPVKTFGYYTSTAQQGLLQTETVPGIDTDAGVSEPDCVKTYVYTDSAGNVQPGPTSVTYDYASGPTDTSYEDKDTTTIYDEMGRVLTTTDDNGRTIQYVYDGLGRTTETIYVGTPNKSSKSFYSSCCGLDYTEDEDGRQTHYAYYPDGKVWKVWTNQSDLQSGTQTETAPLVVYTYDSFGNVHTVTTYTQAGGTGRTTTYTYDKMNRVTSILHPSALGQENFMYDVGGNLIAKQDGNGEITAYEYDDLSRLIAVKYDYNNNVWPQSISYPLANPDVTYEYEDHSRLRTSMTDSTGVSSYEYDDPQDRLTSYTPPAPSGREITYTYNNLGQKKTMTNGSTVVNYDYYANGWLKRAKLGSSSVAEYTYDVVGNRTNVALGNGTSTDYDYDADPRYRISGITHNVSGTPSTYTISYASRDSAGNPLSVQDWNGTTAYTYDNNSRLVQTGGYDWVGNRNPSTWTYNNADQLTARPGYLYEYDYRGNVTFQSDDSFNTQKYYEYTPTNLVSSVQHLDVQGEPSSTMTWDADGNRISFTDSDDSETTEFVYDTTAGIPAVIEELQPSGSPGGSGSVYYIREPDGALIARLEGVDVQYYHFDHLGSTRFLTNAQGMMTDEYSYDAWGNITAQSGSTAQPYRYVGQLGYYTHYQDANLPLLQLGVRLYDPALGRFTQVDPIPSDYGAYIYARDRSTSLVDPSGLWTPTDAGYLPSNFDDCKVLAGRHQATIEPLGTYCKSVPDWKCLAEASGTFVAKMVLSPENLGCALMSGVGIIYGMWIDPTPCIQANLMDPMGLCVTFGEVDWEDCKAKLQSKENRRCTTDRGQSFESLSTLTWHPCTANELKSLGRR